MDLDLCAHPANHVDALSTLLMRNFAVYLEHYMTATPQTLAENSQKDSTTVVSYRKYCCCLCTESAISDLFYFDTSIHQEIREESEIYDLSIPQTYAHLTSAEIQEQQTCYKLVVRTSGIIWFIQYVIYSVLLSFYNMDPKHDISTNINGVVITIILLPLTSLIFLPIFASTSQCIYKIGLSQCIVIGLLLEGLSCILFGFIPQIIDSTATVNSVYIFYICNGLIRVLCGLISVVVEVSMLSVLLKVAPEHIINGAQIHKYPLFCMIGLMVGPFLSGYLYCFVGYELVFIVIGVITIMAAFISKGNIRIPSHININNTATISYTDTISHLNIIYASITNTYSLICITYLLSMLTLYLNDINPDHFNTDSNMGLIYITTCYLIFAVCFVALSFVASSVTYRYCGSLKTMLSGMFGMCIGLLLLSNSILIGLIIVAMSSAFSTAPFLLYLRNALFRKYRKQTTQTAFNLYRFSVYLGLVIGPLIGCLTHEVNIHFILFMFFIIALLISLIGCILFKCLRWKWINDEIKYMQMLQDDKIYCCKKAMCFFSFGALCDRHGYYKQSNDTAAKTKNRLSRTRKSFDETEHEDDDITGKLVTIRKKPSKFKTVDTKFSFAGVNVENEYVGTATNENGSSVEDNAQTLTSNEVTPREKSRKLNLDEKVFVFNDEYDIRHDIGHGMSIDVDACDHYDEYHRSRRSTSTPGSVSPFNPSTPQFNANYYRRVNENVVGPMTPYSGRPISRRESLVSNTGTAISHSHTFLLLSDDDFMSKHDGDLYYDVPEESAGSYFSAQ